MLTTTNGFEKLQNYQVVTDVGALHDLKNKAKEDPKAALRPVAEQFEALFVQQIFKEARKVSFDDGWLDGGQADFYKSWHDEQLSQSISAKGSLGLADNIVEQLAPKSLPMSQSELEDYMQKQQQKESARAMQMQAGQVNIPSTQDALAIHNLK